MSYQFFGAPGARNLAAEALVRSQKTGKTVLEEMISPSKLNIKMTKPPPTKGKVEEAKEKVAKPEVVVTPEGGTVVVPGLPTVSAQTASGLGTGAKVAIGVGALALLGVVVSAARKKKR
jgi:hypothetical protein